MREKLIAASLVTSGTNSTPWVSVPRSSNQVLVVFNTVSGGTSGNVDFTIETADDAAGTNPRRMATLATGLGATAGTGNDVGVPIVVTQRKFWVRVRVANAGPAGSTFTNIRVLYKG